MMLTPNIEIYARPSVEALHSTARETAMRGEKQLVAARQDLSAASKKLGAGSVSAESRLSVGRCRLKPVYA